MAAVPAVAADVRVSAMEVCEDYLLNHLHEAEWERRCIDALNEVAAQQPRHKNPTPSSPESAAQSPEVLANPGNVPLSQHDLIVIQSGDREVWVDPTHNGVE